MSDEDEHPGPLANHLCCAISLLRQEYTPVLVMCNTSPTPGCRQRHNGQTTKSVVRRRLACT